MQQQVLQYREDENLIRKTRHQLREELARCQRPMLTTKFNPYSGVLLHLVTSLNPTIPVVWIDTGYNTRDTLAFAAYLQSLLSLNLQVYKPAEHVYVTPPEIDTKEHAKFVTRVKLEPCARAIDSLGPDVWFSSLRSSQSAHRNTLPDRENVSDSLSKVYPLLEWSDEAMEQYLAQNGIAVGPECYDPTKGDSKRECGLHTQRWIDPSIDPVPRSLPH